MQPSDEPLLFRGPLKAAFKQKQKSGWRRGLPACRVMGCRRAAAPCSRVRPWTAADRALPAPARPSVLESTGSLDSATAAELQAAADEAAAAQSDSPPQQRAAPQRKRLQKGRKAAAAAAAAEAGADDEEPPAAQPAAQQRAGSAASRPRALPRAAVSDASTAEQQPLSSGSSGGALPALPAAAAARVDRPEVSSSLARRGSGPLLPLVDALAAWTPGKGFKKRSEIDRRLDALLFPSGKMREPSRCAGAGAGRAGRGC